MSDLYFYDIEVFKYNSMVVFKNQAGETVKVFSSSLDGLGEYVDKGIIEYGYKKLEDFIRGKTLVGYNNYFYDDYILYAMSKNLDQYIIKEWNDSIIGTKSKINMQRIEVCKTLDTFQQISVSKPSLKKVEGNMGISIVESGVDFNIERPLTPEENLETLKYCEYDVGATIKIFDMRKDYFESKTAIVNMLDDSLQDKAMKWNTTSIVGQLLRPKRRAIGKMMVDDKFLDYVDEDVKDMWGELNHTIDYKFKTKKIVKDEFKNLIEFGWGGLHGAPKGFVKAYDVKLMDVASMYPNILINLNGLSDKTDEYKRILDYRLKLKHEGKKKEQAPYKLILNSTYGLLNNRYSQINNPALAYSICINGQIAVYELAKRLAMVGGKIININTDGVAYTINNDMDMKIKDEWEKEFNLDLEVDRFKTWIQKDVNNYIAVDDKGNIKVKGGDVNKYHSNNYFANNDIRITHIALVDYLVHQKPIRETILENLDKPHLFQYVLQVGSTYKGVVNKDEPDKLLDTKINRVFAVKEGFKDKVQLQKKRKDDGLARFPDAPSNMYLFNDDLGKLDDFKEIVDKQWYYDLILKNLKRWSE